MYNLSKIFSDGLSIFTISMCIFLKVPQIRSIYIVKNARGINIYGLIMELGSYSATALYNYVNSYAVLTYMEYPILIVQEYILIYLALFYQDLLGDKATFGIGIYFFLVVSFAFQLLPSTFLTLLLPLTTPISLSSKGVQLWEILKSQNADSVSVSTWIISAATNASLIMEVSDESFETK